MSGQRDDLARVLGEHWDATHDPAMYGWSCGCGWPADDIRHAEAEYHAHVADSLLAAGFGPVRVVEGERDAARVELAEVMLAAGHDLEQAWARAESAEAALAALRAGIEGLAATWEADDREHLNRFGQHLMGGAVLSCAEHLRALASTSDREEGQP